MKEISNNFKSGFVAVIGKPNGGKSTLINRLVKEKVSIVSPKPQTTRDRIMGVLSTDDYQLVFVDTPGIHNINTKLSTYMMKGVDSGTFDADVIVLVIDGTLQIREQESKLIEKYSKFNCPLIIAVNKIDVAKPEKLFPQLSKLNDVKNDVVVIPISAKTGKSVDMLLEEILKHIKPGMPYFPDDMVSDKPTEYIVSERLRERILYNYEKEIPHGVGVVLNRYVFNKEKDMYEIDAEIICEKQNHKAIIIGKGGEALKKTASEARRDIEVFLDKKVHLTCWVKVKEKWKNDTSFLRKLGYDTKNYNDK